MRYNKQFINSSNFDNNLINSNFTLILLLYYFEFFVQ